MSEAPKCSPVPTLTDLSGSCPPRSAQSLFLYLLLPPGPPADAIFSSKPRENETCSFSHGIACLQSSLQDAVLALSCLDAVSFRVFLKKQTEAHNKGTPLPFKIDLVKQKDVPQVLLLEAFHRIYGHEKHHGSCFQSLWVFKLLEQLLGDWLRP